MRDYLACVASVDDNVGRMLDYLDKKGLAENTIVIYTSDQGFFLGDHDWFDKRSCTRNRCGCRFWCAGRARSKPGSVNDKIVINTDFAPMLLDAGAKRCRPTCRAAASCRCSRARRRRTGGRRCITVTIIIRTSQGAAALRRADGAATNSSSSTSSTSGNCTTCERPARDEERVSDPNRRRRSKD